MSDELDGTVAAPRIEDLPLVAGASQYNVKRFGEHLDAIARHVEAGSIPQARLKEMRSPLLDRMGEAWMKAVTMPLWAISGKGRDNGDLYKEGTLENQAWTVEQEVHFVTYQGIAAVRRLAGKHAKALAAGHPPEIQAVLKGGEPVLKEMLALAQALEWLQERATKRAPPGSAPPEPELPKATRDAQAAVRVRMREVLADLRAGFADAVEKMVRKQAGKMEEVCGRIRATMEADAAAQGTRHPEFRRDPETRRLVLQAAELRYLGKYVSDYDPNTYAVTRHPDGDEQVRAFGRQETDRVFHLWTERNVAKLSPIVEAKGGVTIDVIRAKASPGGVETLMAVSFPDGSRFRFSNAIEYAFSSSGKEFARFPARFHDAHRADGTRIRGASEARVVGEFVTAAADAGTEADEEVVPPGPGR